MLLDWLLRWLLPVTSKNHRSFHCRPKSLSPLHFPSIPPTPCRPLLLMWDSVLLTDKNETQTGHEAAEMSWLVRRGHIGQGTLSGSMADYLNSPEKLSIKSQSPLHPTLGPALTKSHPFLNPGLKSATLQPGQPWFGPWFTFADGGTQGHRAKVTELISNSPMPTFQKPQN